MATGRKRARPRGSTGCGQSTHAPSRPSTGSATTAAPPPWREAAAERLRAAAWGAAGRAYAPYSRFRVGAALECEDGTVVLGANVENRSYGLTCCAERSAFFAAVTSGHRRFRSLAVVSPDSSAPLYPCGACRQVLSELVEPDFPVLCFGSGGECERVTMRELYPRDSLHDLERLTAGRHPSTSSRSPRPSAGPAPSCSSRPRPSS